MVTRTAIETSPTGTVFDFAALSSSMVHVEDIARALSLTNRFGGHTSHPYSVAQHSLLVHRLVREAGGTVAQQFAALHHDSHEAYFADIPSPAAYRFGDALREFKADLDAVIAPRFGIDTATFHDPIVKAADTQALMIESHCLKVSQGRGGHWHFEPLTENDIPTGACQLMSEQRAEALFLAAHDRAMTAVLR